MAVYHNLKFIPSNHVSALYKKVIGRYQTEATQTLHDLQNCNSSWTCQI